MTAHTFTIQGASAFSGYSRSRLYLLIAEGKLDARKDGKRTIIMGDSLRSYLEALPPAKFGNSKAA